MPVVLTSKRLKLRPWRADEHDAFAALNAEPDMARYLSPFSRARSDAMLDRIVAHVAQHGWGYWAIEEKQGDAPIGSCGLMHVSFDAFFTPAVEVSWRLSAKFQGRGLAREAAQTVLGFAFQSIRLDRVVAFTATANAPSWGLMKRLGMHRIGEFDNSEFPEGHALRVNVVYEVRAADWRPS